MPAGRIFRARATIVASTMDETLAGLRALGRGEPSRAVKTASIARRDPPRIAFLFTGQGAQYAGMAKGLYDASHGVPTGAGSVRRDLRPQLDRPLLDVLFPKDPEFALIDETRLHAAGVVRGRVCADGTVAFLGRDAEQS